MTAIEALNKSIKLAKKLVELGVKKGDAVTVNSENRIEYVMVPLACFYIGAIFAPLNPDYTSGNLYKNIHFYSNIIQFIVFR